MKINTEISQKSWIDISNDKAQIYLHYYPKNTKNHLSDFISKVNSSPTVVDLGCGNAQIYPILKEKNPNLQYIGVDITENLLDVAKNVISIDDKLVKQDIFEYLSNLNEKFDFLILSHMIECVESPDFIMSKASDKFEYIAVLWYDYPRYDFDSAFLAKNPHSEEDFKPFIRRKISKDYWNFILKKNNLKCVYSQNFTEGDAIEIYKKENN